MTGQEALKGYDALWVSYRKMRAQHPAVDTAPVLRAMVDHCRAAVEKYESSDAEKYVQSMWRRRLYLHLHGRHGEVYSGVDALRWEQSFSNGWVGRLP